MIRFAGRLKWIHCRIEIASNGNIDRRKSDKKKNFQININDLGRMNWWSEHGLIKSNERCINHEISQLFAFIENSWRFIDSDHILCSFFLSLSLWIFHRFIKYLSKWATRKSTKSKTRSNCESFYISKHFIWLISRFNLHSILIDSVWRMNSWMKRRYFYTF